MTKQISFFISFSLSIMCLNSNGMQKPFAVRTVKPSIVQPEVILTPDYQVSSLNGTIVTSKKNTIPNPIGSEKHFKKLLSVSRENDSLFSHENPFLVKIAQS